MRIFVIALLLFVATAARAQDTGPIAKRTAMGGVGLGVSIGAVAATDGSVGGILLAPLASTLSVYGTGLALRREGDFVGYAAAPSACSPASRWAPLGAPTP